MFASDNDVEIKQMDCDKYPTPEGFNVDGFPTLYFKPANEDFRAYTGGRNSTEMSKVIRAAQTISVK